MACAMTTSILKTWKAQGTFVRFKDGDTRNCSVDNLEHVQLENAMRNIDTWTVDWDMDLTPQQIALVRQPEWRKGLKYASEGRLSVAGEVKKK